MLPIKKIKRTPFSKKKLKMAEDILCKVTRWRGIRWLGRWDVSRPGG